MRLLIPGNVLLATAKCSTFEEAVVKWAEALKKHIARIEGKQKLNSRSI